MVALVGNTGAGKSTLISLLTRLYDPWHGEIQLHGTDARQIRLTDLRQNISVVPQEPFLLPISVAENIAYGFPAASRSQIEAAARAAGAEEFILRLPKAYDALIGERGAALSGGQRQRLAIARAYLKDAPILILDEPSSALDNRTESDLVRALEQLKKGRTVFVIAHRFSTVCRADQILVFVKGRIVQQGQHTELLAARGAYQQLHDLQMNPESRELALL
jgi:ATP-binding cassette subfamily B protein/subfamily B ATP-binding cassette protein MsbA